MIRIRHLLPFVVCLASACDPVVHVSGRVRTASGAPVVDAEVLLILRSESRFEQQWTDSTGRFSITRFGSFQPPFELRVCRLGYQYAVRTFASVEALRDTVDLVLVPNGPVTAPGTPTRSCMRAFRPAT